MTTKDFGTITCGLSLILIGMSLYGFAKAVTGLLLITFVITGLFGIVMFEAGRRMK